MMLMQPNAKKRAVTLILGSMKPDFVQRMGEKSMGSEYMETTENDDYTLALKDAGRKVMDALDSRDVGAFVDYMKELIYLCDEATEEPEMEG